MKNRLYAIVALFAVTVTTIHSMHLAFSQLPEELGACIENMYLLDIIPNQIAENGPFQANKTTEAVNISLVHFSSINKYCHERANNPHNICFIIQKLFQQLRCPGGCGKVARQINTPGSRNYILQSMQLFENTLTPEKITSLHKLGADLDYTNDPGCRFEWPLIYWVRKNNIQNVKQLLALGANIEQSFCVSYRNYIGAVSVAQGNSAMLTLLLTYKPKRLYLFSALKQNNKEIFQMLVNASTEDPEYRQTQLNDALKECITPKEYNIDSVKLLLDHGAQPECVLPKIISQRLLHTISPQHAANVPSLELLETLCNYPVTDTNQLEQARTSLNKIITEANNMLKSLNTCTEK